MDLLQMLLLVALTGLVGWLLGVAIQLREEAKRSARLLAKMVELLAEDGRGTHHRGTGLTNFGVWTYNGSGWQLSERRTEPGFVVGDPPRRPGAYPGETVRKPAVRGS